MSSPTPALLPSRGVHVLKSLPGTFEATWLGDKRHEVRAFDRPYVVGDSVLLLEYSPTALVNPTTGKAWPIGPTGWWGPRVVVAQITNLTGPQHFGLPPHLCCFTVGNLAAIACDVATHDYTRPPRPSLSAQGLLPRPLLEAWVMYQPRPLEQPRATAPAVTPSSPSRPKRKPPTPKGRR